MCGISRIGPRHQLISGHAWLAGWVKFVEGFLMKSSTGPNLVISSRFYQIHKLQWLLAVVIQALSC